MREVLSKSFRFYFDITSYLLSEKGSILGVRKTETKDINQRTLNLIIF
jgi:hypothetical protein